MQSVLQGKPASFLSGTSLCPRRCARVAVQPFRPVLTITATETAERLRLHNLSPWEGSRRQEKRKGRGYGAGQGGTCGFGNRGQNARSGPSVRPGFEGGQMPLYRKLPKLRGIAGGMHAGLPKYVTINLDGIAKHFEAGQEVTLEALQEKGILNLSGREAKLPLKVLGDGEIAIAVTVKAAKFSASAAEKITAAGGSTEEVAGRTKWTKKNFKKKVAEMKANGLDYYKVKSQRDSERAVNKAKKHVAAVAARQAAKVAA